MATKAEVKAWFLRGLKPLQSQFHAFFDSIFWKDDGIDISNVNGLQTTLNNKADSSTVTVINNVVFPESLTRSADFSLVVVGGRELEKIRFRGSVLQSLKIGYTAGGEELMEALEYEASTWHTVIINEFNPANRTIYISGLSAETEFLFYKR